MGSFRPGAGNQHLHWYFNFTGCIVETVLKSLRLSCGVGGPIGAIAGTIPCAIAGGVIGALGGNNVGHRIDER